MTQNKQAEWGRKWRVDQEEEEEEEVEVEVVEDEEGWRSGVEQRGGEDAEASWHEQTVHTHNIWCLSCLFSVQLEHVFPVFSMEEN